MKIREVEKFRIELGNLVHKFGSLVKSDCYEMIGVLEFTKQFLVSGFIDAAHKHARKQEDLKNDI